MDECQTQLFLPMTQFGTHLDTQKRIQR
jgi:hypothetical protein